MRRAQQFAFAVVGPAMQRANNIATRQFAGTFEDHGLAVTTDVGDQVDVAAAVDQRPRAVGQFECTKIAIIRHHQFMADVSRAVFEKNVHLTRINGVVEVPTDRKLCRDGSKLSRTE